MYERVGFKVILKNYKEESRRERKRSWEGRNIIEWGKRGEGDIEVKK